MNGLVKVFSLHIASAPPRLRIEDTAGTIRIVDLKFLTRTIIQLAELSQGEIISVIRI